MISFYYQNYHGWYFLININIASEQAGKVAEGLTSRWQRANGSGPGCGGWWTSCPGPPQAWAQCSWWGRHTTSHSWTPPARGRRSAWQTCQWGAGYCTVTLQQPLLPSHVYHLQPLPPSPHILLLCSYSYSSLPLAQLVLQILLCGRLNPHPSYQSLTLHPSCLANVWYPRPPALCQLAPASSSLLPPLSSSSFSSFFYFCHTIPPLTNPKIVLKFLFPLLVPKPALGSTCPSLSLLSAQIPSGPVLAHLHPKADGNLIFQVLVSDLKPHHFIIVTHLKKLLRSENTEIIFLTIFLFHYFFYEPFPSLLSHH